MNFLFNTPTRLIVGCSRLSEVGEIVLSLKGNKAFVITGQTIQRHAAFQSLLRTLSDHNIPSVEHIKPAGEPDVVMTDQATEAAKAAGCNIVISLGGGSVIDLGKAVAGLVTNGGSIADYLEGVGKGYRVEKPALPHIAIPTTAGAGAEVTRNAVIRSSEGRFKKSFRSPYLYPAVALLDAELTFDLPAEQTAYSGMDAITQLVESYISKKANPVTDALAYQGLELALPSIRKVYQDGTDVESREKMLLASTLSGICLANAGLGMAHGYASGLGGLYDIPHGKVCAILLPHALKFNRCARLDKLARLGRLVTDDQTKSTGEYADLFIQEIVQLNREFKIPFDLKSLNIPKSELELIAKMSMGNSMSGNPTEISPAIAQTVIETLI